MRDDLAKVPVICTCGSCGATLTEGVAVSQVRQLVIICPECGKHNETLDS